MRLIALITMILVGFGVASTGWLWLACILLVLAPVKINIDRRGR